MQSQHRIILNEIEIFSVSGSHSKKSSYQISELHILHQGHVYNNSFQLKRKDFILVTSKQGKEK